FAKQLEAFPMEKIHVQTDKTYYMSGEDVWFRIFLVNAFSHLPDSTSRYVYAELINPVEELVQRVKIRPVESAYFGYFSLPEDLPEGNYLLRFYTRFMEGRGEDCFFKRAIRVGDPLSALYYSKTAFSVPEKGKKKITAAIQFFDIMENKRFIPEKISYRDEKGNIKSAKIESDSTLNLNLTLSDKKKPVLYLEYDYLGKFHKEFIPVELSENDYDVSFFPEGGAVPSGENIRMAFKSLNTHGLGEDVSGVLVNVNGDTIKTFASQHAGMGSFSYFARKGEVFHAICRNRQGTERRFRLPEAHDSIATVNAIVQRERIKISVTHSENFPLPENLYIVIHCRGFVFYAEKWDTAKNFITINQQGFPSGVLQILLTDDRMNVISERLVFSLNNNDLAQVALAPDKKEYGKRAPVTTRFLFTDADGQALNGNFAVSVTDDAVLSPDTTVSILSSLLLTSELKGYIEDPAYYFRKITNATVFHLDELMMTQGWRRYDASAVLKGNIQHPQGVLELGETISGTVKGGILMTVSAKNTPVTIVSFPDGGFGQTHTDNKGRFVFNLPDFADSTRFLVQGLTQKGGSRVELLLDSVDYPASKYNFPLTTLKSNRLFSDYVQYAEKKFVEENGMHTIYLDEVVVTAKRREMKKGKSSYSSSFNTIVTSEEFEKYHPHTIFDVLMRFPGVIVTGGNTVSIRGGGTPLLMIDDFEIEFDYLNSLVLEDVDEIEVVKDGQTAIFGSRGGNGAILITTKRGFDQALRKTEKFNIKTIRPLGYQKPKEFYSPAYETQEEIANKNADLRSVIYWNPNVKIVNGKAEINFYTSDNYSGYSIVVEGITENGKLIRKTGKM
ncbi:MAG: TonB-dependent receptor plug domain-containing protein, partial [Prevotella sp.]|nr:TonB-dependent receptor plug domain-containing protein [Prevotella sp.]